MLESFEVALDKAAERHRGLPVIIGEDVNARVGNLGTYSKDLFASSLLHPVRLVKDTVLNKREEFLQGCMKEHDYILMNGRTENDRPSELTFLFQNGGSTIDLIWITAADVSCVKDLNVNTDLN